MFATLLAASLSLCAAGDTTITLHAVTVSSQRQHDVQMRSSQASVQVGADYLQDHFAGSLMQTLEAIPGVKAMSIGSGQSKPAIRGLGFNRIVVSEDGIKHEGQQWGADHGLEVDQFAVDRAEVVKGPAALLYGSDAIGGVLNLYTNHIPTSALEGTARLFCRSNNAQLGLSAKVGGCHGRFFYRANATLIDYGDYRVPTDSIEYYSYYVRLPNRRLRNTAGLERDGSVMVGYAGYRFHADIRVSDSYSHSGFFADAHGMEVRLSKIDYNRSSRDIDVPSQWVNHFNVLGHASWHTARFAADGRVAYQRNVREEHSEPVAHGYMPRPSGTLERRFVKDTWSGNAFVRWQPSGQHELQAGVCGEWQRNRRGGWGFVMPDFDAWSGGVYAMEQYRPTQALMLQAGMRCDVARTHILSYTDWYATPVAGTSVYMQRSADLCRRFSSMTWSAGMAYSLGEWVVKANAGKSFRVPIPKELGADGINYHVFRYEQGNAALDPEECYQLDAAVYYNGRRLAIRVEPYASYFPNYIYLSPTLEGVEGLQLYRYTQASVGRCGIEAAADWHVDSHWTAQLAAEWLYARQQSGPMRGYTLPFSTPWSVRPGIRYSYVWHGEGYVGLDADIVGRQSEIVPPEKPTASHWTLNATAGKHIPLPRGMLHLTLQAENLLNRRYYDHTSYYRLIDVPEPGFGVSFMLGWEF